MFRMEPYIIMPLGVPGVGKSTVLNFMIGDDECKTFQARKASQGVTRQIKIVSNKPFLGRHEDCRISAVDIPGIGDPTLSLDLILEECEREMGRKTIDCVLLVLKATDDRISLGEAVLMNTFQLIKGIQAENVIVVLTRCDQEKNVDDAFIQERLSMLSSFATECRIKLDCSRVVRFNKTSESLEPLKALIRNGSMHFSHDLVTEGRSIKQTVITDRIADKLAETEQLMKKMQLEQQEEAEREAARLREQREAEEKLRSDLAAAAAQRRRDMRNAVAAMLAAMPVHFYGGGGGGLNTPIHLPFGQVTAIFVRSGQYVDAVGFLVNGGWSSCGGGGGHRHEHQVSSTEYIAQVHGSCGCFLDRIGFVLRDVRSGAVRTLGPFGGGGGGAFCHDAGEGNHISVVHLRTGAWVDAVAFQAALLPE